MRQRRLEAVQEMIGKSVIGRSAMVLIGIAMLAAAGALHPVGAADATAQPAPLGTAGSSALPCVEVQIGSDRAGLIDCLNQQFRRAADSRPIKPAIPYGTSSPPTEIGLFNESAERERLGNAFGHSAQPQRPPR